MKVIATNACTVFNKRVKELQRIPAEGEVFEVSPERAAVLAGDNRYGIAFVTYADKEAAPTKEVDVPTAKKADPLEELTPEVYVIEPGKEPVKVEEKPKKKKAVKKDAE